MEKDNLHITALRDRADTNSVFADPHFFEQWYDRHPLQMAPEVLSLPAIELILGARTHVERAPNGESASYLVLGPLDYGPWDEIGDGKSRALGIAIQELRMHQFYRRVAMALLAWELRQLLMLGDIDTLASIGTGIAPTEFPNATYSNPMDSNAYDSYATDSYATGSNATDSYGLNSYGTGSNATDSYATDSYGTGSNATDSYALGSNTTDSLTSVGAASFGSAVYDRTFKDANSFFFTQFTNAQWNPHGPSRSNNCGPASLAMALKAFGKPPPGASTDDPEQLIESARQAMTGNKDSGALTSYTQIEAGAQRSGLNAQIVVGLDSFDQVLDSGGMVVAGGNPARAWGGRLSASQYAKYNGGHFVLVVGKNADGYIINDPLSRTGSLTVPKGELQAYLSEASIGYGEGVALRP